MNPHLLGRLLVGLQFAVLAALLALCLQQAQHQPPGFLSIAFWLTSVVLGLWTLSVNHLGNFNIHPEPKAHGHLVTSGPYRWVRHPMYGAVLLLAAGASAWLMTWAATLLGLGLLVVLVVKAYIEETWLLQTYAEYADYRQRTFRLIPWIY